MFKKYSNYDFISYLSDNWINTVEEDRWRLILESWNSKNLLDFLIKKVKQNNTDIIYNSKVIDVITKDIPLINGEIKRDFKIILENWITVTCDKLVITTWWKSFGQVWTTWDWYEWARKFWHTIITPHRWLCWLVSQKDLSTISWVSAELNIEVISNISKKIIYKEYWPLLFTHYWLSWPIIFNTSIAIWEYINSLNLTNFIENIDFSRIPENEKNDYFIRQFLKDNIILKLTFNIQATPKRIINLFKLTEENNNIFLELQDYISWKEAKVTWWWIKIDELTNNLESKIIPGLYFAWEIIDITWKTWWFNLQFAWTSWHIVWQFLW
jgi:hypothetical protein